MTIDDTTIDQIATAVAQKLAPMMREPRDDDLLTAEEVAAYLRSKSARVVSEKWAKRPDFPAPTKRRTTSGRSCNLWFRGDIVAYAKKNKERKGGRE